MLGAMSTKAVAKKREVPSFDEAIQRLSQIVDTLEKGDVPLEDALTLFEEGIVLSRTSQEKLDAAQKRIDELLGVDEGGEPRLAGFELRGDSSE